MSLDTRALELTKIAMDCHLLTEETKHLLQIAYTQGATNESHLHAGENGNFGQAIASLKMGKRVARKGWSEKDMYLWLKEGIVIQSEWCKDPMLLRACENNSGTIEGLPTICMKTADNKILTGWLASQTDMLANDWVLMD